MTVRRVQIRATVGCDMPDALAISRVAQFVDPLGLSVNVLTTTSTH